MEVRSKGAPLAVAERESIWSVTGQTRDIYFVVFTALFLAGVGVQAHHAYSSDLSSLAMTRTVWESSAPLAITSAAAAMVLTEIGRIVIVVIAEKLEARYERKGEEKERQRWVKWNERREAAEAAGEPFREPPPSGS